MSVAELRTHYKGCSFTKVYVARYGWYGEGDVPSGIQISQGDQPLLVYFTDWEKPNIITGLIALHKAYRTGKKIGVGTTSEALRTAIPAIRINQDSMDDYGQNLQMAASPHSAIVYTFAKQKDIARYSLAKSSFPIVISTAKISWITVYPK